MDLKNNASSHGLENQLELQVPPLQTSTNTHKDVSVGKEQVIQRFQPYCLNNISFSTNCAHRSQQELSKRRQQLKKERDFLLKRHNLRCENVSSGSIHSQMQKHNNPFSRNNTEVDPEVTDCSSACENNIMNCVEENSLDNNGVKCTLEDRAFDEQLSKIPTIYKITNKVSTTAILPICETSIANITLLPLHSNTRHITCTVSNLDPCDRSSTACFISNIFIGAEKPTFNCSAQLLKNPACPLFLKIEDPRILLYTAHPHTILMPAPRLSSLAWHAANRIIRHARNNKTPNIQSLLCQDCNKIPCLPVTGKCGHTRCSKCIEDNGSCICGSPPPKKLFVNTVIQDLIENITSRASNESLCKNLTQDMYTEGDKNSLGDSRVVRVGMENRIQTRPYSVLGSDSPNSLLMNPQSRLKLGRELLSARHYKKAAVHLARVAAAPAASPAVRRQARSLLVRAVSELCSSGEVRRVTREVCRLMGAGAWVRRGELECALCYHTFTSPVTTPCGHTYCRTCLERSLDYRKACALCLRPLHDFHLASTGETVFICAALASIDALNPPLPMGPDVIPIFVCTVAFPAIPCPLLIFDPRYWLMIRRVLESGSRKFGMVAYERGNTYSDYGTVLEVCDCVHFEDGRSILSTVGVSRFKIIERDIRDGCDVARIEPLIDEAPAEERIIWDMRIVATQISYKALLWLNSMNRTIRAEIEAAFGHLPHIDCSVDDLYETPDGPSWLWWLIAILPLRAEIKVLILSTKSLLKRMLAVSRTLDVIDHVALSASFSSECELRNSLTGADDWLETNS